MADIKADAIFPYDSPTLVRFPGRRSVVHSTKGMVACSQPLAAEAGQRILRLGGNAADAAVAVAAAMNVTEPASTGAGGDMFCLYFNASTGAVQALNGSGRSPKQTTLAQIREELGMDAAAAAGRIPVTSPLSVTVPGAPAGWIDTVAQFGSGKLTLEQILQPAIELAEDGFPVSEISAKMWKDGETLLKKASPNFAEILKTDRAAEQSVRAPRPGEILQNPALAQTFRALAAQGKAGFYTGRIAEAIVEAVQQRGGHMALSDLEDHMRYGADQPQPLSLKFHGKSLRQPFVELWEHPPNGQGIVALMALGLLEQLEAAGKIPVFTAADHNTAPYLHALIEALRIAFGDASWWVTDPHPSHHSTVSPADMVSPTYLAERAKLFDPTKAKNHGHGRPSGSSPALNHSDTVYLAVTDAAGNAMSFINSNFREFGSGIVPRGCGFVLQNRGGGFDLGPADHPNIYAGGKRPYHTIIPGLVTVGGGETDDPRRLHSVLGVMGGLMQPQGHVQVLLNMDVFRMNPQQALDAPRICISAAGGAAQMSPIFVEEGIREDVIQSLRDMGHNIQLMTEWSRVWFGRGQVIRRHVDEETGQTVFSGGSDGRGDGCAMPA